MDDRDGYKVPTYLVVFESEARARDFVESVLLEFPRDVSMFVDGISVFVFDATTNGARERIMQLSRSSSATMAKVVQP